MSMILFTMTIAKVTWLQNANIMISSLLIIPLEEVSIEGTVISKLPKRRKLTVLENKFPSEENFVLHCDRTGAAREKERLEDRIATKLTRLARYL